MPNKDPLQFIKTPVKKGINGLLAGLIISLIVVFAEFVIILNLIILKPKDELSTEAITTEEYIEVTTEDVEITEKTTEAVTEEITEAVTEEITEDVTEEITEEIIIQDDLTTREYYYLFNNFFDNYNEHQLQAAIENSYLPQLREVILNQTLQGAGATDEANYWDIMNNNYGGTVNGRCEPTAEAFLDEGTIASLVEQLSGYGFTDTIEQAVSVSITETYYAAEDGIAKTAAYNTYILIKTGGVWWITGRQAQ